VNLLSKFHVFRAGQYVVPCYFYSEIYDSSDLLQFLILPFLPESSYLFVD
jgi:hypothetical protein